MSAEQPIEVRDMKIVHKAFRRAYTESAELVRANPTPSAERVTFLADHIDFGVFMLHDHHASEDLMLYPLLEQRDAAQAEQIDHVDHQHIEVADAIDAVSAACAAWRAQPTAETGEALAASLDHLNARLQPHLDDEEGFVNPLAAVFLTQEEWDAVGEHSRSAIPKNKLPIAFGMLMEPLDESDRAYMKSGLPAPVRLLYPFLIDRPWKKYAQTLRSGT